MDVKKIAERMKIVTYHLARWSGQGNNKEAAGEINQKHNTDKCKSASVTQCDHPLVGQIAAVHTAWRNYNDLMTRPTIHKGMRLLPLCHELEHAQKTGEFKRMSADLVSQFAKVYPGLKALAPSQPLYDAKRWPDKIEEHFEFNVRYMVCPTEGDWGDWLQASAVAAVASLKEDLEESVKKVAERCASEGRLHEAVFTNLKDILDGIDDFDTEGLLGELKLKLTPLADHKAEDVRDNKQLREQLASDANRLLSIFGGGSLEKLA